MKVLGKAELEVDLVDVALALRENPKEFARFISMLCDRRRTQDDPLGQRDPFSADEMSKALACIPDAHFRLLQDIVDGTRYIKSRPAPESNGLLRGGTLPFRIGDAGQ